MSHSLTLASNVIGMSLDVKLNIARVNNFDVHLDIAGTMPGQRMFARPLQLVCMSISIFIGVSTKKFLPGAFPHVAY